MPAIMAHNQVLYCHYVRSGTPVQSMVNQLFIYYYYFVHYYLCYMLLLLSLFNIIIRVQVK